MLAIGDLQIEDVLPSETVFSCSINNIQQLASAIEDPDRCLKFQSLIDNALAEDDKESFCDAMSQKCQELLASAGIDEDWKPEIPSGYAGLGIYPIADFEIGSVSIAMMAILEVSNSKLNGAWNELVASCVDMYELDAETVDINGEDVWMFDAGLDPNLLKGAPMDLGNSIAMDHLYVVETNGYVIFCTEPDGISRAITVAGGELVDNTLASHETYTSMIDQIGEGDMHAALLLDNLADVIMQADQSQMIGMFLPMLKSTIGDIDGFAQSVTLPPSEDVFIDANYTIWMPDGRNGLLGIASEMQAQNSTPTFVGEDTISYSQINIDFTKVAPWIRSVMGMNPMMPTPPQMLDEMEANISAAVAPLGNTVHVITTMTLPLSSESMGFLLAVECEDGEAMETYLSTTMSSIGTEPHDFLGYRIFPIDTMGGMMMGGGMDVSLSMAVGGGWTMFGMSHSVEHALRLIANPDSHGDGAMPNSAAEQISKTSSTGWGYADVGDSLVAGAELSEIQFAKMIEEMESFDPEMAAEMQEEFDTQIETTKTLNELLASFLGSSAWTLQANEDGFTAHAVLMYP